MPIAWIVHCVLCKFILSLMVLLFSGPGTCSYYESPVMHGSLISS